MKMKLKYDNGRKVVVYGLLKVENVETLSPKSAEMRLTNSERTFRILLPDGFVESEPVEIVAFKKQPSINEVTERYAPINFGGVWRPGFIESLKPGTWAHDFFVGDHRAHAHHESGACTIRFKNGERRDCYISILPTTPEALAMALQAAQARELAPVEVKPKAKREVGRPKVDPKEHKIIVTAIKAEKAKGGNYLQAVAILLNKKHNIVKAAWERERKRKAPQRMK